MAGKITYVCSPYGGKQENIDKARGYMRAVIAAGDIPIASHVLLHGVLDDNDPEQRAAGLQIGLDLLAMCDYVRVFGGTLSPGMRAEMDMAEILGIPVEYGGPGN